MQMSTTHSSFNQYHALVTELSHRAAVASGPDVRRECSMTKFPAFPLLVTNPGDATVFLCMNWCERKTVRAFTFTPITHMLFRISYLLILWTLSKCYCV